MRLRFNPAVVILVLLVAVYVLSVVAIAVEGGK